jgi:hypothetical protein
MGRFIMRITIEQGEQGADLSYLENPLLWFIVQADMQCPENGPHR